VTLTVSLHRMSCLRILEAPMNGAFGFQLYRERAGTEDSAKKAGLSCLILNVFREKQFG
jgi:hypothetical protein